MRIKKTLNTIEEYYVRVRLIYIISQKHYYLIKENHGVWEDFEQLSERISKIDFSTTRTILQLSYSINKDFFIKHYNLSKKDQLFYGFNEVEELCIGSLYNRITRSEQSIYKE